jgi:hypothetical protein
MLRGCLNAGTGEQQRIVMPGGRGLNWSRAKLGCRAIEEGIEIQCTLIYPCANYLVC